MEWFHLTLDRGQVVGAWVLGNYIPVPIRGGELCDDLREQYVLNKDY